MRLVSFVGEFEFSNPENQVILTVPPPVRARARLELDIVAKEFQFTVLYCTTILVEIHF